MKTLICTTFFVIYSALVFGQESIAENIKKEKITALDERIDSLSKGHSSKELGFKRPQKKEMKALFSTVIEKKMTGISIKDSLVSFLKQDTLLKGVKISTNKDAVIGNTAVEQVDILLRELSDMAKFSSEQKSIERNVKRILSKNKLFFSEPGYEIIDELGMYDGSVSSEEFKDNLGYVNSYNTVQYLYQSMRNWLELKQAVKRDHNTTRMEEKLQILAVKLNQVANRRFYKFGFTDVSKQHVKDISVFTHNDLFAVGLNQDMNHTGGLHLNIGTDKMKMRLLPYINNDNIVSYQMFETGFDVYTPYIRDTNQVIKELSYAHDRPFASTFYFGRVKYRLHKNGHIRHTGRFNLMIIGGSQGQFFQELLHKDFTVSSIKPVGWEHQISEGGRLGFTIHHKFDFLLSSPNAALFEKWKCDKMRFFNPFFSFESRFSYDRTFLGGSLNFSSRDFFNSSGNQGDFKLSKLQKVRVDYVLGFDLQYTIHNSTISDFGMFKRQDDDPYDDEYTSYYYMSRDQLIPWIWKARLRVNFRYRQATFFYEMVVNRKEFRELPLDDVLNPDHRKILEERFDYKVYGVGTIGLIFNL
ncbi:hypothetical protein D3C87_181060 [compost metagenome]